MAHPCPVQQPIVAKPKAEALSSIDQWLNDAHGQFDTDWRNAVELNIDNREKQGVFTTETRPRTPSKHRRTAW